MSLNFVSQSAFIMEKENDQLAALNDIRRMMKESSRFLSLSGLSGILAGVYALAGAFAGHTLLRNYYGGASAERYDGADHRSLLTSLAFIALAVLVLSLATAFVLSGRKARKTGHKLFDYASRNLMWSMAVPLMAGGIVCLSLLLRGGDFVLLVCPVLLIFYGLALFAGSRLTLPDVRYLGYFQIALGLVACFYPGHGLIFWSLGFGVLHIIYGSIMWYKYERSI